MSCRNQESLLYRSGIALRELTKISLILNVRQDNTELRRENTKLREENTKYKEALRNRYCPTCGFNFMGDISYDERFLRIENARLREEIERIAAEIAKYVEKPLSLINSDEGEGSSSTTPPQQLPSTTTSNQQM